MPPLAQRGTLWPAAARAARSARSLRNSGATPGSITVYYDGDCGFCNSSIQWLLKAGIPEDVRFASQQGAHWARLVEEIPRLRGIDSVVVTVEHQGRRDVLLRSEAIFWLMAQLPGRYRFAWLALLIPLPLLDVAYRLIAAKRGLLSRVSNTQCTPPPPEARRRFLS